MTERLRDLDNRVDMGLRQRRRRLLLRPGDYRIIGSTRAFGWLGRPRLLVRVWRDQAVLISWAVYLFVVSLACVCTVVYVHLWEGPGHSAVAPAVIVAVIAIPLGAVMRAAALKTGASEEDPPSVRRDPGGGAR